MDAANYFVGAPEPPWLAIPAAWPLFVSRVRLARRPHVDLVAARPWALDSGGFSELSLRGRWTVSAAQYADEVAGWIERIGRLEWAAQQDWMCEPWIIQKTGLTVREHQARTVANYLELIRLAPGLPWVPVLQGWEYEEYHEHAESFRAAGVDLAALPVVGLGSVCRRQDTAVAEELARDFHRQGIRLHGFGFKLNGLVRCARYLASADSMAWSYAARKRGAKLPGCTHRNCANCYRYAEHWRGRVLRAIEAGSSQQLTLW